MCSSLRRARCGSPSRRGCSAASVRCSSGIREEFAGAKKEVRGAVSHAVSLAYPSRFSRELVVVVRRNRELPQHLELLIQNLLMPHGLPSSSGKTAFDADTLPVYAHVSVH